VVHIDSLVHHMNILNVESCLTKSAITNDNGESLWVSGERDRPDLNVAIVSEIDVISGEGVISKKEIGLGVQSESTVGVVDCLRVELI
jgi:hypothetical protein